MSRNLELPPRAKLYYRVWSERSGYEIADLFRAVVYCGMLKKDPSTIVKIEEKMSFERIQQILATQPDWSDLPDIPIDLEVEKLIDEAFREANEG
ncbi:MAG TPA: hypothetical protein VJH63_04430 [Candidatus Paceibacterota bacterium]